MNEVRFGPGGIPDWLEPMVRYCSRCGTELRFGPIEGEERDRLACPSCGFVFYVNPRLVVTTLPVTESGDVMLIRRGIEPGYGMWAQPGGFLEIDETVRDAAIRETLEETGLQVEPGRIIGLYSRVQAAVVVIAFEARIVAGEPIVTHEALETRPFAPDEIPWQEIAFETSIQAIHDWVLSVRPDLPLPDPALSKRAFGA
ncbi:MAG TPA: NUDIX hydrolase [Candidatus Limnocylindrales bacterium]